jgi:ParB-like chromosome segregation protein Spo0J
MTVLEQPAWTEVASGEIDLDDLRFGPSRRAAGIDAAHVETLKELEGNWPPIVVAAADRTVVDGLHRVHAALALGLTRLPCVYFVGGEDDAYVEFVHRNIAHGLPLSRRDRESAATRLLRMRPEWSDRRIAAVCGLAAGTVARVRRGSECSTDEVAQLNARVGRDGRHRPVDRGAVRARIADALRDNPRASLRAVAALVGTSPATVRSVRSAMVRDASHELAGADEETWLPAGRQTEPWEPDAAVLSTDEGSEFAAWFTKTAVGDEWWSHVISVPVSRIYDVADEARRRAQYWSDFARALEARSSGRG